jgi:hypothetical protein
MALHAPRSRHQEKGRAVSFPKAILDNIVLRSRGSTSWSITWISMNDIRSMIYFFD